MKLHIQFIQTQPNCMAAYITCPFQSSPVHPPSCFRADALPETQQTFAILSLQFCATLQYIAHLLQQTWLWWMVSHGESLGESWWVTRSWWVMVSYGESWWVVVSHGSNGTNRGTQDHKSCYFPAQYAAFVVARVWFCLKKDRWPNPLGWSPNRVFPNEHVHMIEAGCEP